MDGKGSNIIVFMDYLLFVVGEMKDRATAMVASAYLKVAAVIIDRKVLAGDYKPEWP